MAKNLKYEWCEPNSTYDKEFLGWIYTRLYTRLHEIYGESADLNFMKRLENIIDRMPGIIPSKMDKMLENSLELAKKREAFCQALSDLAHPEATCYSHWALEAFDKAHGLR